MMTCARELGQACDRNLSTARSWVTSHWITDGMRTPITYSVLPLIAKNTFLWE